MWNHMLQVYRLRAKTVRGIRVFSELRKSPRRPSDEMQPSDDGSRREAFFRLPVGEPLATWRKKFGQGRRIGGQKGSCLALWWACSELFFVCTGHISARDSTPCFSLYPALAFPNPFFPIPHIPQNILVSVCFSLAVRDRMKKRRKIMENMVPLRDRTSALQTYQLFCMHGVEL